MQNGVLKSLSFLFEYIGEMAKDYCYALLPLLEDALMDRDAVHRQTAARVVQHLSLGVAGLGREDAMAHLLNYVWPNIFETSPHVINAVTDAIDGLRVALGPTTLLQYLLQGLFHPARKVRTIYWKLYNVRKQQHHICKSAGGEQSKGKAMMLTVDAALICWLGRVFVCADAVHRLSRCAGAGVPALDGGQREALPQMGARAVPVSSEHAALQCILFVHADNMCLNNVRSL